MFPFTVHAFDNGHYIEQSNKLEHAFLANKPKGEGYYAFDTIIHSPTSVTFIAFGMRDMCYGGIGDENYRFDATVVQTVTETVIAQRARLMAIARRSAELDAAEKAIIDSYAAEIIAAVNAGEAIPA